MSTERDDQLSRGFDAGNYANAYESVDYAQALARLSMNRSAEYIQAFTLGFFSSYEPHEMGMHEETWREAMASEAGKRCVELGYVDEPENEPEPYTQDEVNEGIRLAEEMMLKGEL